MPVIHDILAFTEIGFLIVIVLAYWRGQRSRAVVNDRLHAMSTAINALVTGQQEIDERLSYCDKIGGEHPAKKLAAAQPLGGTKGTAAEHRRQMAKKRG